MSHEVIKSHLYMNTDTSQIADNAEDKYFNIRVQHGNYPSCYQYNILIMLAKRLLKEDQEKINACKHRTGFDRKIKNVNN